MKTEEFINFKSKVVLFSLVCFTLFFTSFISENEVEILPKEKVIKTSIISKKSSLIQSNKKKHSFKKRLALKLIKKKINRIHKNEIKNSKREELGIIIAVSLAVLGFLIGLISGVIYLFMGELLLGILLMLLGIISMPFILILSVLTGLISAVH